MATHILNPPSAGMSWEDPDVWSTSLVPSDGDTVIVPGTPSSIHSLPDGPIYDVNLAKFIVKAGYSGDLGENGNPFENLVADEMVYSGTGTFYYAPSHAAPAPNLDVFIIDSTNLVDAVVLSGDTVNVADVTYMTVARGGVQLTSTHPTVTDLRIHWVNNPQSDSIVSIAQSANPVQAVTVLGGAVTCSSNISTVDIIGGVFTHTSGQVGVSKINNTGVYVYNSSSNMASPVYFGNGGTLDLSNNPNEVVISEIWRPNRLSTVRRDKSLHTVTTWRAVYGGGSIED